MASSVAEASSYDQSTYWIAPARNFRTSARLHLQHMLFQNTLGFFLEPRVHQSAVEAAGNANAQLRVADLGCGNGVWLNDLERELSKQGVPARLDGYDVNPVYFPAPAFLPPSVTLQKLDVLAQPLPAEILGTYDIVHARALGSVVVGNNGVGIQALLANALALLKPGGWLQWEESRADTYVIEAPAPDVSTEASHTLVHILQAGGKARGMDFGFLGELDRHLGAQGFKDVHMQARDTRKQDRKAWTEDYLMVWEELAAHFPPKATAPQSPMTREGWTELFSKVVAETEQGVVAHQGKVMAVVGRKPL